MTLKRDKEVNKGDEKHMLVCLSSPSSGRMWEYYELSSQRGCWERREPEVWQGPPNLLVDTGQAAENHGACLSKQLSPGEFLFFFQLFLFRVTEIQALSESESAAVVQSLSPVWLSAAPWTAACQAPVSSTISQSLGKSLSIESVMPSNQLTLCLPLLLSPSIFPSITSWQIDGETVKTVAGFIFEGLQNHCRWWLQTWN